MEKSILQNVPARTQIIRLLSFFNVCNTFCKFSACTTQNKICPLLVTLIHDFRKGNRNNSNHLFYDDFDVCSSFCKFSGWATHGELCPLPKTILEDLLGPAKIIFELFENSIFSKLARNSANSYDDFDVCSTLCMF